jgi:hypothetical protein
VFFQRNQSAQIFDGRGDDGNGKAYPKKICTGMDPIAAN